MKKNNSVRIFLADLGHTYFNISPATLPIGISYIKAMLQQKFNNNVNISIFRYPEALLKRLKEERPDIVGFGIYAWNENLSLRFADIIRKMYPDTLLVAGGLNIPGDAEKIREYYINKPGKLFDVYMPYEGELPMVQLLERVLGASSKKHILSKPIQGCYICDRDGLIEGEPMPFVKDVAEIPSPYLTGVFDELLRNPILMPVIQTMRGCPYRCMYCVSGERIYSKIRPFPIERVKDEILYIKQRTGNRSLRITDDNFGVLERDVELAEFIGKLNSNEGYPVSLKVYTDKSVNERVRKVMLAIGRLIPYNISLQSTTPEVLKIIGRKNPPMEKISEAFRWAKTNGIVTSTELLHGFPGETYETFMKCVNNIYELRVDSAASHEVWLLPNTELASKNSRERYKFESKFTLGADGISVIDGELICDYEEHVISSKYMAAEEHYKLRMMDFYIALTLYYGYFRELSYHAFTYGIKPMETFNHIMNFPREYPILNDLFSGYIKKIKSAYYPSKSEVYNHAKAVIESNKPFFPTRLLGVSMGEFVFGNKFGGSIDEYIAAMNKLCGEKDNNLLKEFGHACKELKKLAINMVINPEKLDVENIRIKASYDFPKWIHGCYSDKLSNHRCNSIELLLSVPSPEHFRNIHERGKKLSTSPERKQYFFRNTNSSLIRKRVGYSDKL